MRNEFGGLDALFINAGVAPFGPLDQWTESTFDRAVFLASDESAFTVGSELIIDGGMLL